MRGLEDTKVLSLLSQVCESGLLSEEDTELPKGFKFSKEFEQKMRDITGRGRIHIRKRLKLALFAAAIFAVGFMLGMARQPKWSYLAKEHDEGIMMTFDVSSVKDPKNRIEEKYTLAGIPEGFEQDPDDSPWLDTDFMHSEVWGKYDGKGNGIFDIYFGQYIPAAYRNVYINDSDKKYLVTEQNGIQYFMLEPEGDNRCVIWYQDGYVFLINAKMSKEDILKLCKTLKLKES